MAGALATVGKVAQGVQTARTIKGAIGGSRQKGAIVKQKRPRLAQFSKGVEDAKSGAIIKRPTILPSLGSTPEARVSSRPRTIKDKLDAIIAFIKERKNLKKNTRKGLRKTKEKSEREEKENLKENPAKKFIKGVGEKITAPVKSLWDQLLKIVGTLLSAQITMWAIDNPEIFRGTIQTLRGIVNAISNTIVWTVGIVGGIAEFGYKIADTAKEWTYAALGEDGAAKLKEIEPAIMGFLNVLVGIGAGIAALNLLRPKAKGNVRGGSGNKRRGTRTKGTGGQSKRFRFPWQKAKVSQGGKPGFRFPWQKAKVSQGGTSQGFRFPWQKPKVSQGGKPGFRFPWQKPKVSQGMGGKGKGLLEKVFGFFKDLKLPVPRWLTGWKGNALINAILAGFEFKGRKKEGQSNKKAIAGTTASTAGGFAGFWAGAKLGTWTGGKFGSILGPKGTAAGALIGGIIGGIIGATTGSGLAGSTSDAIVDQIEKPKTSKTSTTSKKVLSKKIKKKGGIKKGSMWNIAYQKVLPSNFQIATYSQEEYDKLLIDLEKNKEKYDYKSRAAKNRILGSYVRRAEKKGIEIDVDNQRKKRRREEERRLELEAANTKLKTAEALTDTNQPKDVSLVPLPVTDGSSGGTSQPSTVAVAPVSGSNVNNSYGPLLHANFYKS